MEEEPNNEVNPWYKRLALLSILLFALFWSLGSFFFWTLLGLSAVFGFMALYSSGIKISLFDRPAQTQNPHRPYEALPASPEQNKLMMVRKVIRVFVIGSGAILTLLFLIGIFSDKDTDSSSEAVQVDLTEPPGTDEATTFTDKGNVFFDQAQYDSALYYYEKVLGTDPENQSALYNKALVFYMKKDFRRSITWARRCLRLYPDYNVAWWLLGDDYSSVNNLDSASSCLEKAYANDYSDPGFLQLMADVYFKKGNRTKAKELYLKVLEQDSTKPDVFRQLAELDPANADRYRKKASALEQSSN